ncbi:uncharacterized protein LOC142234669 [Haematobia irritans]|uniref:Putative secreted protein n=1 Tax=Haematobia irritans TaxID=7368 RepID=A0A1L8EC98_HAEIR
MAVRALTTIFLISFLCTVYGNLPVPIGRANIEITDKRFQCDRIECPLETERCVVTKEKHPKSNWMLVNTNICYAKDGRVLKKAERQQSIDPKVYVSVRLEGTRNAGSSSFNAGNDSNEDENDAFNRAVDELSKDFDLAM